MSARALPRIAWLDVETPQGHAGRLVNERGSFVFVYDRDAGPATSVSLLMPVRLDDQGVCRECASGAVRFSVNRTRTSVR